MKSKWTNLEEIATISNQQQLGLTQRQEAFQQNTNMEGSTIVAEMEEIVRQILTEQLLVLLIL